MKRFTLFATVVLALLSPAYATTVSAQPGGEGNNTNCNGQGNPNSPCTINNGGQGGQGGHGGVAIQGQIQGQKQSQANTQTNAQSNSQINEQYQGYEGQQNTTVSYQGTTFDRYAPPVGAPALTSAGTGVCLGSVSIGLSGPMAGASFGITKVDKGCELRSNAALLYQFGFRDAAIRLLMKNEDVREAMEGSKTASDKQAASLPVVVLPTVIQGN